MSNCDCPNCVPGNVRKDSGIKITYTEIESMQMITNHLSCAEQAANPNSIPDGIDPKKAAMFIAGALFAKSEAQFLNDSWWKDIKLKYKLTEGINYRIDFGTGDLFYYIPGE